jgi:hypothetical protein
VAWVLDLTASCASPAVALLIMGNSSQTVQWDSTRLLFPTKSMGKKFSNGWWDSCSAMEYCVPLARIPQVVKMLTFIYILKQKQNLKVCETFLSHSYPGDFTMHAGRLRNLRNLK